MIFLGGQPAKYWPSTIVCASLRGYNDVVAKLGNASVHCQLLAD